MEEALFVEKERAQVTLNSIGDAVACTDISGNITFLNLGRGKNDRLVAGRKRPAGRWPKSSGSWTPRARETTPESDGDGGRAKPDRAPAVELHSGPARRT